MNVLPIIIIIFMLFKDRFNSLNLLDGIDLDSVAPILELFNVDKNILNTLNSNDFKQLLNGNINLKTLLPLIMPLLNSFNSTSSTFTSSATEQSYNGTTPIRDIAGQNIIEAFENYFD